MYFSFNGVQYTVSTEEEMREGREQVGTLASGEVVFEKEGSHLKDHPTVYPLVGEALGKISSDDRTTIVEEVDLGRIVGENICVETTDADEIVYARRSGREGVTRFVKNREPEPSSKVVVIVNKCADNAYCVATAFIGGRSPAEPWDTEWADENSVPFWNTHALVWGEAEVVPGTETSECPW
jgi:hypothetical protein